MTYAPPSGVSVYDLAYYITQHLPSRIIVPTRVVGDITNNIITNAFLWIVKPILDAISSAIALLWEQLGAMLNGAYQTIVNVVYNIVINPLKALVADALNRIYDKLEGVIFIAVTIPAMIMEAKSLMHNPSMKGLLLFMFKPIIGAVGAKLISDIIKPSLRPITIEPSIPSTVTLIPPPKEVGIPFYDVISVDDELTLEVQPPLTFTETIRVEDYLTLEALPPMSFSDSISIEDYLTLETIPPLTLVDNITVEDTLIAWVE
jgi:hypothetical protein